MLQDGAQPERLQASNAIWDVHDGIRNDYYQRISALSHP
jgi:hypothetical protein